MHLFFEDDGQLKVGSLLSEAPASAQVELPGGRRVKVRSDRILLRFANPSPGEASAAAQALRQDIDLDFLWEVSSDGEFTFESLARDYYGDDATAVQKIAVAQALYGAPMYFYKKGRGLYKKAPTEALNAARASLERKAREAAQVEAWCAALAQYQMPEALVDKLAMLLYAPDKNALEYKAFQLACDTMKLHPVVLADRCGVLPSSHEYHFNRFLFATFPKGTDFPTLSEATRQTLATCGVNLPLADVDAFTIDDHTTTEYDDAFSVNLLPNGNRVLGIHIACPTLAVTRGSELDLIARDRLSTVYMPGRKITMFPDEVIDVFTLKAGTTPPVLSLYTEIDEEGEIVSKRTQLNRIRISNNYSFNDIDDSFASQEAAADEPQLTAKLRFIWQFAQQQCELRGKIEIERTEYSFYVDWEAAPEGRIDIVPRRRGSPLDRLIAECAIYANNQWGEWLADNGCAGIYRTKTGARVRMSTQPGEHQGLGVAHYLWATSPLRRYTDIVNQSQILAVLHGVEPPYPPKDNDLFAILASFEAVYKQYADFQRDMERYWCLRWLLQEQIRETEATVLRRPIDNPQRLLVRLAHLPLTVPVPDLPAQLTPGTHVQIAITSVDPLFVTVTAHFKGLVAGAGVDQESDDSEQESDDQ